MPGVPIHILSGAEEAAFSAEGVLCGIPAADGVLADIGGGSMELVRLVDGARGPSQTLRLGVIRLAERSGGDLVRARTIAEDDLQGVPWLGKIADSDLYLVGGAWRALARIHLLQTGYPLHMVHHYVIGREEARDLAGLISTAPRKVLEKLPGAPRRRIDDLPFAAIVLRRLLRLTNVRRVVFSASGLREGWFMRRMPAAIRLQDPLLSAVQEMSELHGRDPSLPPALVSWTNPVFPMETLVEAKLREAVCWVSDIGSHDHPEFRAEQAFLRVLRQPGIGLDHHARAFLALSVAIRYEADLDAPFLAPARLLLDLDSAKRAEVLGTALRLAYTLSAFRVRGWCCTCGRIAGSSPAKVLCGGWSVWHRRWDWRRWPTTGLWKRPGKPRSSPRRAGDRDQFAASPAALRVAVTASRAARAIRPLSLAMVVNWKPILIMRAA
jgi:exopolyphosphatase/guanosine-5'-triphosphate,3'-diphosphate pyrophosphatase